MTSQLSPCSVAVTRGWAEAAGWKVEGRAAWFVMLKLGDAWTRVGMSTVTSSLTKRISNQCAKRGLKRDSMIVMG